jgi:hypothetical protein
MDRLFEYERNGQNGKDMRTGNGKAKEVVVENDRQRRSRL